MSEVLQPRDEADVAEILADGREPLEVVGGGSRRHIGRPVAARLLELSRLSGVIDYQPQELVLTARAATPLAVVAALLAAHGQRLAFEPPAGGVAGVAAAPTLGGVIASNWSGSRRVSAGAARDHFLGFRAVNGRGERFAGGARVVKNVTGYDIPKLLAGSWGTLAVLTEVAVKVVPAAEHECTVLAGFTSLAGAVQLCSRALGSAYEVSAAAVLPGRGVALRLEGLRGAVAARATGLRAHLGVADHALLEGEGSRQLWSTVAQAMELAACPVIWRLSVPPADAPRVVELLAPQRFLLDWGGGLVWIGADVVDEARVRGALAGPAGGHATLVRASEGERRRCAPFPPPGALAHLVAGVKAAFDPRGLLNPGRME